VFKTDAGNMAVLRRGHSKRLNTTILMGQLRDGSYAVSSRFHCEVRTTSKEKAEAKFDELTKG